MMAFLVELENGIDGISNKIALREEDITIECRKLFSKVEREEIELSTL